MKVKMKRHETFSIREGWIAKGIKAVETNQKVFSDPNAMDILGIGSNMVKSLRYWMNATGLIEETNRTYKLSSLGTLIKEKDPYLEDTFSWWLIHINLILNKENACVFNIFFNKCHAKTFEKSDLYRQISDELDTRNLEYNEKILSDEINMIIKTYCIDEKIDNPENNFICPLSELNLIKKIDKNTYERNKPIYKDLSYQIVYYLLQKNIGEKDCISIDDLLKIDDGPAKILNLDKNLINEYLDEMKRNGLVTINRTAGLNMVYLRKKLTLEELFNDHNE